MLLLPTAEPAAAGGMWLGLLPGLWLLLVVGLATVVPLTVVLLAPPALKPGPRAVATSCSASSADSLLLNSARTASASNTSCSLLESSTSRTMTWRCSCAISTCCWRNAFSRQLWAELLLEEPPAAASAVAVVAVPLLLVLVGLEARLFVLLLAAGLPGACCTWQSVQGCRCQMLSSCC